MEFTSRRLGGADDIIPKWTRRAYCTPDAELYSDVNNVGTMPSYRVFFFRSYLFTA